jgi:hypothetical protein
MMSLKHEELGLQIQNQALQMQRVYHWHARQPTKLRVLMLMVPGNLSPIFRSTACLKIATSISSITMSIPLRRIR